MQLDVTRMLCPRTPAAVQSAPASGPRMREASSSVAATRSAARQATPLTLSPSTP